MGELKKCECGKWVSAEIAFCWSCWNKSGKKSSEFYCTCGVDISPKEYGNECTHESTERSARMTAEQYKHYEFWCSTTEETEGSWIELEVNQAKEHLLKQIDIALENGSKVEFLELTEKLSKLVSGGVVNG